MFSLKALSTAKKAHIKKIRWNVPNITRKLLASEGGKAPIVSKIFQTTFDENSMEWSMKLYPVDSHSGNVGFYLFLGRHQANFKVDIRLSVTNSKTGGETFMNYKKSGPEFAFGCASFINMTFFLENFEDFVVGGRLRVGCLLIFEPVSSIGNDRVLHSFLSYHKKMFLSSHLSDFELIAEDENSETQTFNCHRIFLALSTVFREMFEKNTQEALEGKYMIPGIKAKVVKEMLRYMYYHEVEGINSITQELFKAAEKFNLSDLKSLCCNSFRIPSTLQGRCIEIISDNFDHVSASDEWKTLPPWIKNKIQDLRPITFDITLEI